MASNELPIFQPNLILAANSIAVLGIPLGTVKSRVRLAVARLRRLLEQDVGLRLEKTGRGRFRLCVAGQVVLSQG